MDSQSSSRLFVRQDLPYFVDNQEWRDRFNIVSSLYSDCGRTIRVHVPRPSKKDCLNASPTTFAFGSWLGTRRLGISMVG